MEEPLEPSMDPQSPYQRHMTAMAQNILTHGHIAIADTRDPGNMLRCNYCGAEGVCDRSTRRWSGGLFTEECANSPMSEADRQGLLAACQEPEFLERSSISEEGDRVRDSAAIKHLAATRWPHATPAARGEKGNGN